MPIDYPRVPDRQYPDAVDSHYQPDQGACQPKVLRQLPAGPASDNKRAECAEKAENHRVSQQSLEQSFRATNAAEEALRLGYFQTRIAFIQSILSTLAAVFTGWAAWEAGKAALAAQQSVEDARTDAEEQARRFDAQFKLTKKSADAAKDGAVAMQSVADSFAANVVQLAKTVKTNQEIADRQRYFGEMQMRAYLSVIIGSGTYQDANNPKFIARPTLTNLGNTAARHVRHRSRAAVLPVPLPENFKFTLPPDTKTESLVPPHQSPLLSVVAENVVPPHLIDDAKRAQGQALYVWGLVTYVDVFKKRRRVTYSQVLEWVPTSTGDVVHGYFLRHNRSD